MRTKQYTKHDLLTIAVLAVIFAFVLGVLVYIGGPLLQTVHLTQAPEPKTALESVVVGAILGIIFGLIQRYKK